jgi:hypothetical protein
MTMNALKRCLPLAAVLSLTSSPLFAQQLPPGWDIAWGATSVPVGPWVPLALMALLGAAGYLFLRHHRSAGFMTLLLAAALVVTGYSDNPFSANSYANGYDFTIGTPAGSGFVSCYAPSESVGTTVAVYGPTVSVGTTVSAGVVLTRVDENFGNTNPTSTTNFIINQCQVGLTVLPTVPCQLPCPQGG